MECICLYARSGQTRLYAKVGRELEERGLKTVYIVQNDDEEAVVASHNPRGRIYNITAYLEKNWDNTDLLQSLTFAGLEEKYGIDSIWRMLYTDRFLVKYQLTDVIKFAKLHFALIEEIVEQEDITVLLNEGVALFSAYVFFCAAELYNYRYLALVIPRNMAYEKLFFSSHIHSRNEELDNYYKTNDLTPKELSAAKKVIDDLVTRATKPEYLSTARRPFAPWRFAKELLRYGLSFSRPVLKQNYEFYHERTDTYLFGLKNYLKYLRQRLYYQEPDYKRPYYFFPLHFQPESTTLVDAPNYEKQAIALDLIAKKIPGDALLYVKEHPWHVGHRNMSFYTGLSLYPNVRMINPWEDSHRLVRHSKGVIVLTSTVGWEAMMYGKPVFVLGRVFYESFRFIHRIDHIDKLTEALRQSESNWPADEEYSRELIRYVAAYLKSLKPGNYYLAHPQVTNDENVKQVTESILTKVRSTDVCQDQVRQHH